METMVDTVNSNLTLTCPQCNRTYIVGLAEFSEANNYQVGFRCVACNTGFIAKLDSQTRPTEHRNEAEAGEQKSHSCLPTQHDWKEEYYGYKCLRCQLFVPFGSEPWLPGEE